MVLLEISQRHDKGGGAREQVKPYNGESVTGQFFYIFDLKCRLQSSPIPNPIYMMEPFKIFSCNLVNPFAVNQIL